MSAHGLGISRIQPTEVLTNAPLQAHAGRTKTQPCSSPRTEQMLGDGEEAASRSSQHRGPVACALGPQGEVSGGDDSSLPCNLHADFDVATLAGTIAVVTHDRPRRGFVPWPRDPRLREERQRWCGHRTAAPATGLRLFGSGRLSCLASPTRERERVADAHRDADGPCPPRLPQPPLVHEVPEQLFE